jgi:electron transport complex protein RnfB
VRKIARHPPNLGCAILDSSCPGGPFACREACLGLGDCAALCPAGAISLSLGTPRADLSLCRGCGVCERSCPRGLWRLIPREAKAAVFCSGSARMREMDSLCRLGCLGCGLCRKACPLGALGKPGLLGPPQVDYALCRMDAPCRMECREACPRGLPGPAFQPENGDG